MIETSSSAYLLLGMHAEFARQGWRLGSAANYGSGFSADSARWFWFDANAERAWYGAKFNATLSGNAYGLRYTEPFEYSAYAAEVWPTIAWHVKSFELTAMPRATGGFWASGPDEGDISVLGGGVKAGFGLGAFSAAMLGENYEATNGALDGSYRGIGMEAAAVVGSIELGATVKRWQNPADSEWGYSAFISTAIGGGFHLNIQAARSVTDPVLASPGSFGASVGVSWRVFSTAKRAAPPVAEVGAPRDGGRHVTFTVESNAAATMALSGSFTDWQPVPMRKSGKTFTLDLNIGPGTHHYGFVVNGTDWWLPEKASGIVDDGFGRSNATLVIERE